MAVMEDSSKSAFVCPAIPLFWKYQAYLRGFKSSSEPTAKLAKTTLLPATEAAESGCKTNDGLAGSTVKVAPALMADPK